MIEVTVSELRDQLADLLGKVHYGEDVVHVQRHGKPLAVIISQKEFDFLEYCEGMHWAKEVEKAKTDPDYDLGKALSLRDALINMRSDEIADLAKVREALGLMRGTREMKHNGDGG